MGLGTTEILLICFLALILFGGGKLADVGRGLGEGIKNFKRGLKDSDEDPVDAEKDKQLKAKDAK
ncbi:MAG: twin-arginine translocase TatA/TatE family subunit [Polyangiales bacterium]